MKKILLAIALVATLTVAACGDPLTSGDPDEQRAAQTEELMREAARQIPPPGIRNFQELRWQTFLYELRDQELATFSYYMNLEGDLFLICESVGYGMPASVQITNPERVEQRTVQSYGTLPQPEPNGLFMPEGLQATYVLCADGEGGIRPVYWEPELIVSPFPLRHVSDIREVSQ